MKLDLLEPAIACGNGNGADVAGRHRGAAHAGHVALEGAGDRLEDQSFAQPDTQLAGKDLDRVRGLALLAARAQDAFAKQLALLTGTSAAG